jgi:DNA-binding CsgD family transcriptional regulator/tetratricopeptide (TPR) repeat protein
MSGPFVGRDAERSMLAELVRRSSGERRPVATLIVGEAGVGKSRLLTEAGRAWDGTPQVVCSGFEANVPIPLAAAGGLLRALAAHGEDGATLARLAFGEGGADEAIPLRIFEAAHRSLAAHGPLVVTIDDLQWVDDPTLALIHYLLRSARQGRIALAVVAAGRPAPAVERFRVALDNDLPDSDRLTIELGPLSRASGIQLARAFDPGLDATSAEHVWQRARGSPFWVEALARARSDLDANEPIAQRLRSLTVDGGRLLAMLAIGARPVTLAELSDRLGWPDDRAADAAHELLGRGLATAVAGTVRTSHDLIREAVAESLPEAATRELHGRIADAIERTAGDDIGRLREALDHRAASGGDPLALALRIIDAPGRRILAAADLKTLAAMSDGRPIGDPERHALDRGIAQLAAVIGDQELALERWSITSETAVGSTERQFADIEAARAAYVLRRSAEAHRRLDRALKAAPPDGVAAVRIAALRADLHLWLDHETALGARTAQHALTAAKKLADAAGGIDRLPSEARRAYLGALLAAGDAALQEDRAEDVLRLSESIVRVTEGLDDESRTAGLVRVAFALSPLGRTQEAEAHYRRAWEASRQLILPMLMIEAGHGLARILRGLGRFAEAYAVATEAHEVEVRVRNAPRRWGNAASKVHGIQLFVGDAAAALRALRADAEEEPDPHYQLGVRETSAGWQARYSGAKAASAVSAELAAAHAASALAACPRCASELSIVSAELLARIGQVAAAREELAAWDRRTTRPYHQKVMWRMRAVASIAAAEGDIPTATDVLERYVAELQRAGALEDLLWAWIDLGRVLSDHDRGRAVAAFTSAAVLAERLGAVNHARLAARELRRLGVRAWRRGPSSQGASIGALSPREREIAHLVAGGASNREVADALLVSPKTVERHVTNLFAKLGVRNRTELGAAIRADAVRVSPDE